MVGNQLTFDDVRPFDGLFQDLNPEIVSSFLEFHKNNLEIYRLFEKFASEVIAAGHRHYGAAAIFERIRWHEMIETKNSDFKLNNNYRSCYARLLIFYRPEFKDFFETRSTRGTIDERI